MNWLYIVLVIILVLLFLMFVTKITVSISYQHNGDDDLLKVQLRAWKFIKYTFSAPLIKVDKDSAALIIEEDQKIGDIETSDKKIKITVDKIIDAIQKMKEYLEHIVGFHTIIRRFLKHISTQIDERKYALRISL